MLSRYCITDKYPGCLIVREEEKGEWVKYQDLLDFLARKGIEIADLD